MNILPHAFVSDNPLSLIPDDPPIGYVTQAELTETFDQIRTLRDEVERLRCWLHQLSEQCGFDTLTVPDPFQPSLYRAIERAQEADFGN